MSLISFYFINLVSILVLMELCIKTPRRDKLFLSLDSCFNPCFNGTMYKNFKTVASRLNGSFSFNPCFNGTMYKNTMAIKNY